VPLVLVLAHPDDESMFLTPLIVSRSAKSPVYLLCLSTGNYDGKGSVRVKELRDAAESLKIERVSCVDNELLQDSQSITWPSAVVCNEIEKFLGSLFEGQPGIFTSVDVVTFDRWGVSGHVNHISTFEGVRDFGKEHRTITLGKNSSAKEIPISYYSVISWQSSLLKYFAPLLLLVCLIANKDETTAKHRTFVNSSVLPAWNAMKKHYSQWVWYRRLFVLFSSYSYVNVLERIEFSEVSGSEEEWNRRRFVEVMEKTGCTRGYRRPKERSERESEILTGLVLVAISLVVMFAVFVQGYTVLPLVLPATLVWTYFNWFAMKLFVRRE